MTPTIAFLVQFALLLQAAPPQSSPGIVTGLLTTKDGLPAVGMRVNAVAAAAIANPAYTVVASALTDGSGRYRLENVPAGEYYISAGVVGTPTYFPSVLSVGDAKVIPVIAGREVGNIDFAMVVPPGVRVSGRVIRSGKEAVVGAVSVALVADPLQSLSSVSSAPSALLAADGAFEFSNVAPGRYHLIPMGTQLPILGAETPIAIPSQDVTGLIVSTPVTIPITVRIVVDGRGDVPNVRVMFTPLGNSGSGKNVLARGTLITDLPVGEYRANNERLPAGYSVKSIQSGTTDLMRAPLVVVEGAELEIIYTLTVTPPR